MKTSVIVSRKWKHPSIEAFMSMEEIGAKMSIEDVLVALVEEMGNPTMMITKAQLLARLQGAWSVVEAEIKEATRFV